MGSVGPTGPTTTVDPVQAALAATRAKYVEEKNRRLREDGNGQFAAVEGDLIDFAADPFTKKVDREPYKDREVDTAIIGSGFGGMSTAIELIKRGRNDILLIEKAGDVGGTWYWNRYPGVKCDVDVRIGGMVNLDTMLTSCRLRYIFHTLRR